MFIHEYSAQGNILERRSQSKDRCRERSGQWVKTNDKVNIVRRHQNQFIPFCNKKKREKKMKKKRKRRKDRYKKKENEEPRRSLSRAHSRPSCVDIITSAARACGLIKSPGSRGRRLRRRLHRRAARQRRLRIVLPGKVF